MASRREQEQVVQGVNTLRPTGPIIPNLLSESQPSKDKNFGSVLVNVSKIAGLTLVGAGLGVIAALALPPLITIGPPLVFETVLGASLGALGGIHLTRRGTR